MAIEGILFADIFVSNKEQFIRFFVQYYKQNKTIVDNCIDKLNKVLEDHMTKHITATMAKAFKEAWNDFEKKVLLNQKDLQLIVSYRSDTTHPARFSKIIRQEEVEGEYSGINISYGINAGHNLIKDTMKELEASDVEKFLQFHLDGLLKQLEQEITSKEGEILHKYHSAQLNINYQEHDRHLTGLKWYIPFYGGGTTEDAIKSYYYGGRGLGKVYDAFMNHMANKEKQVFDYLRSGGKNEINNISLIIKNDSTVYIEENRIGPKGHFPQLLKDSTNHTGWYTGGDIIIVNPETMSIVYNIQLKTTRENKPSIFGEKIADIRTFLKGFKEVAPEQKAEKIYEFMLTSISNQDDFNKLPQKDIDALVEKTLKSKLNIDIG